jgi:hypothetical protein
MTGLAVADGLLATAARTGETVTHALVARFQADRDGPQGQLVGGAVAGHDDQDEAHALAHAHLAGVEITLADAAARVAALQIVRVVRAGHRRAPRHARVQRHDGVGGGADAVEHQARTEPQAARTDALARDRRRLADAVGVVGTRLTEERHVESELVRPGGVRRRRVVTAPARSTIVQERHGQEFRIRGRSIRGGLGGDLREGRPDGDRQNKEDASPADGGHVFRFSLLSQAFRRRLWLI